MRFCFLKMLILGAIFLPGPILAKAQAPHAVLDEQHREFFKSYCVACHQATKDEGKLRLDDISFEIDSIELADRWQKILNQLNAGEMPPEDARQPDRDAKTEFLDALSRTLVTARRSLSDGGGKITMRRLNRREYKNTIRDLLGVEINVRELPADDGSGTFDTVGSSLFMSSDQFEQYLALGRQALDESFARYAPSQTPLRMRIEAEGPVSALPTPAAPLADSPKPPGATTTYRQRREVELHANAMVGGTYNGYFKGGYTVAKAYLDSDRSKPPTEFGKGIADEQEALFRVKVFEQHGPSFERYLHDPLTKSGAYLTIYNVHPEEVITLPPDQPSGWLKTKHEIETAPPGEYILRFRIGAVKGTPAERHFVTLGSRQEKDDFSLLQTFQISGSIDQPQVIEVPISITAEGPSTFVLREKRDVQRDFEIYMAAQKATGVGPESALWIDWVEWEGPLQRSSWTSQQSLFASQSRDGAGARAVLERFARRAFRDEVPGAEYLDKLVNLFERRIDAGDTFETALKESLSVVLASPHFLYLAEPTGDQESRKLTAKELATRLSYFLWSAPPDDTLIELARSGDLETPEVLSAQVDRMIESEKSREFVNGFVHQWLGMDRLDFFQFNTQLYRDFDESTKAAVRTEVFRTIEHVLRENHSIRDLLKSDYVVINGLLGTFYGIEGVTGDDFRRVSLPEGSPRGGLLGMAAIMAMGSNGETTSPVERGVWVLRKLLHQPPPPAPPAVPQLTRLEGQLLTTRERLLAHQEEPQCASCHRKIDPIGFGLENFNAVGKWRTEDYYEKKGVGKKEWTIDPSGALYKGPAFKDYFELRDIIAAKPELFCRGLAEALIEYALGRPYGFVDEDLARSIVQQAARKDFALRELIHALVGSEAFTTK